MSIAGQEAQAARTKASRESKGAAVPAAGGAGGFSIEGMPEWGIWVIVAKDTSGVLPGFPHLAHDDGQGYIARVRHDGVPCKSGSRTVGKSPYK